MKQLIIISEDRMGLIADISYLMGKARINIDEVSGAVVDGKAFITLMVPKPDAARRILETNGFRVLTQDTLVLKLADKPGEHARVCQRLTENNVSIQNMHLLARGTGSTVYAFQVDKQKTAKRVLSGVLLAEEELA